ncbi:hypothetical protein G5714_004226 [Onychostoma macrolepis]|uniref:Uncharacterized protein n=1 Tax=Onychostoma macrolepis TaxID=369639 RepID=A0A7J6D453_9TELE|nr:hypothetical protein G5714_004226 [Onychostoma macrolepis]
MQEKLKRLESSCKVCQPLLKALEEGIMKHFAEIMKEPELVAAAILLPKCRTSCTTEQSILTGEKHYRMRQPQNVAMACGLLWQLVCDLV